MSTDITPVTPIVSPEANRIALEQQAKASRAIVSAEKFVIANNDDYELAAEELVSLKQRMAAMQQQRDSITKPAYETWQAAIALFKGPQALMEKLEGIWKAKMLAYQSEAEKKRAIAQAEADKKAADEKKRLDDEAAKLRSAAEAAASEGNKEAAEELLEQANAAATEAETVTSGAIVDPRPAARGISTSTKNEGRVANKRAFILHTAAHLVDSVNLRNALLDMAKRPYPATADEALWLELWNVDSKKLDNHVKARGKLLNWPGVEVVDRSIMSARVKG